MQQFGWSCFWFGFKYTYLRRLLESLKDPELACKIGGPEEKPVSCGKLVVLPEKDPSADPEPEGMLGPIDRLAVCCCCCANHNWAAAAPWPKLSELGLTGNSRAVFLSFQ